MNKKVVSTRKSPSAIGPYSQAIRFDNLVFVSGQIPIDPKSGDILKDNIKEQTKQVLENLKNILEASGSSLQNVLRTTIYLTKIENYTMINETYAQYFEGSPPARSTVQVSRLPKDANIEIDAIACINK
ncbi:MAG: RidA family protein [Candidatus Scalinduaceae bacterium]